MSGEGQRSVTGLQLRERGLRRVTAERFGAGDAIPAAASPFKALSSGASASP